MKTGARSFRRRSILLAAAGILAVVLTACTGRGGGQLPPQGPFKAPASFGFTFSCEDSGGLNPPTGQLRIQLFYTDHGTNPLGSGFSIHGIVDRIDPVLESQICQGQNPPPPPGPPNVLIFLGRYRLTSSAPAGFPSDMCPTRETPTSKLCRFEVEVHDNDRNMAPSPGDFFSIQLSSTKILDDNLTPGTVFYTRAGFLKSGNLTVD
jgi:hypothetical protein